MTVLLAGNVSAESNAFGGAGPTNLGQLETAFQADDDALTLVVTRSSTARGSKGHAGGLAQCLCQ